MAEPALYILMRSDMASMTPGKGMAQAAHAANAFIHDAAMCFPHREDDALFESISAWQNQTAQGFGVTLTLEVSSAQEMRDAIFAATDGDFIADIVHDPTYPVRDGDVTHLIPVDTCAYVFTPCRITRPVLGLAGLGLHP